MKKIMVIGNIGSGKSTFARKLGEQLHIPVYHLDMYFHRPDWKKPLPGEWPKIQEKLISNNIWIIDGTYHRTLPLRAKAADIIIFLQVPKWLSLVRLIKRRIMYSKRQRPDLPVYLEEKLSLQLLYKLFTFSNKRLTTYLHDYKDKIIILNNNQEIKLFLDSLKGSL